MSQNICCEDIIKAKTDINNIGEKVHTLETLYKPVNRLTVLFIISIFVLSGCLGLTAYMWNTINDFKSTIIISMSKNDVDHAEIKKDVGYLTKEIGSLKKQLSFTQKLLKEKGN